MLLNNLADVVRSADVEMFEVPGWVGRNHGAFASIECIVIHHTAGPKTGDYPSLPTVRDGRPGLDGPLAQLGGGRTGRMYVIGNGVAWHAGTVRESWMDNFHAIGIEVESAGDGTPWPDAQLTAVVKTTAALCRAYDVPVARVLGHLEVCFPPGRKIDPVGIAGGMPMFRKLVAHYLNKPEEDDMTPDQMLNATVEVGSYRKPVDFTLARTAQAAERLFTVAPQVNEMLGRLKALQTGLSATEARILGAVSADATDAVDVVELADALGEQLGAELVGKLLNELGRRVAEQQS